MTNTYDYIIIGAGSSGCVLANRLSANPKNKVLLLEAGGKADSWMYRIPIGLIPLLNSGKGDWGFYCEPNPAAHNRKFKYPRGKVLGGSSSINAMVYSRGHKTDYDDWETMGNKGWSYKDVLPYFKKSENQMRGASDLHGVGGPINVSDPIIINPLGKRFVQAAENEGFIVTDDFNGPEQDGFGHLQYTMGNGQRSSGYTGYLKPALDRSNLTLHIHAQVTKLIMEDKRVVGVEFQLDGQRQSAKAAREVILSAGAIQSPQILLLSGIGPEKELKNLGIKVHLNLPGVGKNLQDHSFNGIGHLAKGGDSEVVNWKMPFKALKGFFDYAFRKKGMFTYPGYDTLGFIRTLPQLKRPDIEFLFATATDSYDPEDGSFSLPKVETYGVAMFVLNPESRGEVRLKNTDPLAAPAIDLNFYGDPRDLDCALRGFKIVRKLLQTEPLVKYSIGEYLPGPQVQSDEDLKDFLRSTVTTNFHPVGTCKMGNDPMAVVDDRLRVHGLKGLRVVDASIMPLIISGHTNAPCYMIGEKAADLILETQPSDL